MTCLTPTPEQNEILEHDDSFVVIARPGSGKTFIVSEKVRQILIALLNYKGIIAISYTNKASDELKFRCKRNGIDIKHSFFGTIDKFCDSEIIMPFLPQIWGHPSAEISIERIRDLPAEEQSKFDFVEQNQVSIEELENNLSLLKAYFLRGKLLLEVNGALTLFVLKNSKACRKYIQARYSHIFIDEYQDSGLEQHKIFSELKTLGLIAVAVGDVDQSIFGFSGKSSKYLIELSKSEDYRTFPLNFNHRCHNSIINYSLRLFDANSKMLPTDQIHVYEKHIRGNQSDVASWIEEKIDEIKYRFNISHNFEIGILVRGNHTGHLVDQALDVKHRFFYSVPLEEQFGMWAKLFCSLLTYRFNIKNTAEEIIQEFAHKYPSRNELRVMRSKTKYIRDCDQDNLCEKCIDVAKLLLPNAENSTAVTLLSNVIKSEELLESFQPASEDEVQIMTLHKAKGLEFDIVFHLDLYEWVLPGKGPGPGSDWNNPQYFNWEQDLNLHYVGVTRARKASILCTSTERINASGQTKSGNPSEFYSLPTLSDLRTNYG